MVGHNVGTFLQRARSGHGCSARASAGDRAAAAQGGLASLGRLLGIIAAFINAGGYSNRKPVTDSIPFFQQGYIQAFSSSRVTRKADGTLAVSGPLTIHGATHEVEFTVEGPTPPVKDPWGNTRVGVEASTKIIRKDFGLNFNAALETGGVMVGEEVSLKLELEFVQAS